MNKDVKITIPKYENGTLMLCWEDKFSIKCAIDQNGAVVLSANSAGLISFARHLLTLAQNDVPECTHLHFDEFNSLESGSKEVVIVKIP